VSLFEEGDHLGDPRRTLIGWAFARVDLAQMSIAVELGQRVEEGCGLWCRIETPARRRDLTHAHRLHRGPGELFSPILLKKTDPSGQVTVYEHNASDDTRATGGAGRSRRRGSHP
jgi:hypothetical protein